MNRDDFKVIVCAVLQDKSGKILVMRRKQEKKLGGLWEFPGGKLEHGEALETALQRELMEECEIQIKPLQLLHIKPHLYDHGAVLLLFYLCEWLDGQIILKDHDEMLWTEPHQLRDFPNLIPANKDVIHVLCGEKS